MVTRYGYDTSPLGGFPSLASGINVRVNQNSHRATRRVFHQLIVLPLLRPVAALTANSGKTSRYYRTTRDRVTFSIEILFFFFREKNFNYVNKFM